MYTPRDQDILWAKWVLSMLREDALLIYPATNLHYRISHKAKMLVLENLDQLLLPDSLVVHLRTVAVFGALGYKVVLHDELAEAVLAFETHQGTCSICQTDDIKTSLCRVGLGLIETFYRVLVAEIAKEQKGGKS